MYVAEPIAWTDLGVIILDHRRSYLCVIPSGGARFFLPPRFLGRRAAQPRNPSLGSNPSMLVSSESPCT